MRVYAMHQRKNVVTVARFLYRLSSQIVSSPEKFRRQIIEIGQSLRHEQSDLKTGEKKLRELAAWIANVEEVSFLVLCLLSY